MPEKMTDRERQRRAEQSQHAREENVHEPNPVDPDDARDEPEPPEDQRPHGDNSGQIAEQAQERSGKQRAK